MENYEDCVSDADCDRVYHANIRRTNQRNPARYDCPTCGKPRALSAWEKAQGYHCSGCTARAEGLGY